VCSSDLGHVGVVETLLLRSILGSVLNRLGVN